MLYYVADMVGSVKSEIPEITKYIARNKSQKQKSRTQQLKKNSDGNKMLETELAR